VALDEDAGVVVVAAAVMGLADEEVDEDDVVDAADVLVDA
jgi:hypothetical protein